MEDSQLIARAINDHRAFSQLVERHYSKLLSVARAIIGDSLAEEVVQEAWLSAYRNLAKFEGRSSVRTWLTSIVANEARSRLRKESRSMSLESMSGDSDSPVFDRYGANGYWTRPPGRWHLETPEALLDHAQFKCCLKKYMARLGEQGRTALILKDMHGLSLEEICNILEVSASNVRVLIHRARHTMFENIEDFQETGTC